MISLFRNPAWVDSRLLAYTRLEDVPSRLLQEIKSGLQKFQDPKPLVSIVIPVLNEEFTIVRTLHSLSRNETTFPAEIIVINNNSTDRTQEVLDFLKVKSFIQPVPGWGPARQLGLEKALGKYILSADADSFYSAQWIQEMTSSLVRDQKVSCVYGDYSFLGNSEYPRWHFLLYEAARQIVIVMRDVKRPHFNARGLNMGFVKELGLKKGYINKKIKGEDGRMCFDLMQHGKVVRLNSDNTHVWTPPRNLKADGGLLYSFIDHGFTELTRFRNYFTTFPKHDTHASSNTPHPIARYLKWKGTGNAAKKKTRAGEIIQHK